MLPHENDENVYLSSNKRLPGVERAEWRAEGMRSMTDHRHGGGVLFFKVHENV